MLTLDEKLKRCIGCHNNYYNHEAGWKGPGPGDVKVDGKGCWYLNTAKACNKLVYYSTSDVKQSLRKNTLTCWQNNISRGTIIKK
jgi:hypothetical protein